MRTDFIRALERHRALSLSHPTPVPDLPERMLLPWIHHDNMLEGQLFRPPEILQALADEDDGLDRYLHPLMERIRRYRDAIRFIHVEASGGRVTLENLKAIHKMLTPAAKDRGGLYRRTSPVHRDYYQRICAADKIPYHLRKLFEHIAEDFDEAPDPVRFAAEVHHRLMFIYPFRRNPGTTARLFTNLLLISRGYPPAVIPSHSRCEYYDALQSHDTEPLQRIYCTAVRVLLQERERGLGLMPIHC